MTRGELEQKIAVLMGGRAAERLVFDQLSTGASDDLAKATDIARAMVTRYGMDEGLGYIAFEAPLVMGGFERATAILGSHRGVLDRSARALLEVETLDETAIRSLTVDLHRE